MSNLKEALNSTPPTTARTSGSPAAPGFTDEIPRTITEIDVEEDGQLKLKLGTFGWIDGERVEERSVQPPRHAARPERAGVHRAG